MFKYKTMITLNVEENNPITPKFYNNLISNLQFHRLTCPCGHSGCLSIHGYYNRYIKTSEGKKRFRICRVICSACGHTHAILLSSFVPYSQVSLSDHVSVISAHENSQTFHSFMEHVPDIDENNIRYIIRQYLKHWKQRLLTFGICLSEGLVSSCFSHYHRQFMQIKNTPNILFFDTT